MPTITMPYPASSRSVTGSLRFGWVDLPVSIPEASPEEFQLASCQTLNSEYSQSTYAGREAFWQSVLMPSRPVIFNSHGVRHEAPFDVKSERDVGWVRQITEGTEIISMLRKKALEENIRSFRGSDVTKLKHEVNPGDVADDEAELFARWARENLVWCEGRVLKKFHGPSVAIGWIANAEGSVKDTCYLRWRHDDLANLGSGLHGGGLHFDFPNRAFYSEWSNITSSEAWYQPMGVPSGELQEHRQIGRLLTDELDRTGYLSRMVVCDRVSYDPRVILSVPDRQDMAERTVLGVAGAIMRASAPHAIRPGPKRDVMMGIKEAFSVEPCDRPADFANRIAEFLEALPTEGERAREYFVRRAVEMWNDREIELRPLPASAGFGR